MNRSNPPIKQANVVNDKVGSTKFNIELFVEFTNWLLIGGVNFWAKFIPRTTLIVYDALGVGPVVRNLVSPFRHDFTFAGYFVGITVRIFWLVISVPIVVIIFFSITLLAFSFYLLPFVILVRTPLLSLLWVLGWIVLFFYQRKQEAYWNFIRDGGLTTELLRRIWRRLELDSKNAESALRQGKDQFRVFLKKNTLDLEDFTTVKEWVLQQEYRKQAWKFWRDEFFVRRQGVNMGWAAGFLPELKKFSVDLTAEAAEGHLPHVYGRERELLRIISALNRPAKNNVLLVGPAGVGKTSLAYAIAWLILGQYSGFQISNLDSLLEPLKGKRLIELHTGGMVAGAPQGGALEARLSEVIRELRGGDTILFISQLENLIQAGLIGYLTPLLGARKFPIIATTVPDSFDNDLGNFTEFTSEFEVIRVGPPSVYETIRILQGWVNKIEQRQAVYFSYRAIHAAVELSERYIHDAVLPEKAIKILVKSSEMSDRGTVTEKSVERAIAQTSGVPVGELSTQEREKLLNLERILSQRIVGQNEAVREVARAMRRSRTGVGSKERPIATLLFVGPTGVGKTLTAKTLAQVYFSTDGNENMNDTRLNRLIDSSFIVFDMSEYAEPGAVERFIDQLTAAVSERPFALLLLDEFEKAEDPIHNLFLQVFEEGRLTDQKGNPVDFRNVIIIATSNAVKEILPGEEGSGYIVDKLEEYFRPELINRFDGVVMFHPLDENQTEQVVLLELKRLQRRLNEEYEMEITWTEGLVKELARIGFDPEFGARPLRRTIQDHLEDSLARKILRKELQPGDQYQLTVQDLHR